MIGELQPAQKPARPTRVLHRLGPDRVIFVAAFLTYLVIGLWLALDVRFFLGDSLSRLQGATAVLFSREPHLAAMGFIFTPLTTLAELPVVALHPLIPAMTDSALAAVIVSALFMAAAVLQLWRATTDRGLNSGYATAVTLLFALHPVILLYGATGMSEAPFLFAVIWACRRLIRWISTDDVHDLVAAGAAIALAFLARYDALVIGAVGALTVGAISWWRSRPARFHFNPGYALVDMIVFLGPLGLAFATWTAASWLSTGDLLAQFGSSYGNAAIIEQSGGVAVGTTALNDSVIRTLILAPMLPLLLPVVGVVAWRHRDLEPVIPVVLLGVVLVFQTVTAMSGATFGFLRFFLAGVVLVAFLMIQCAPARGAFDARRFGRAAARTPGRRPAVVAPSFLILILILTLVGNTVTIGGMSSPKWAPQEYALQQVMPWDMRLGDPEEENQRRILRTFTTERRLADHLDDLDLPEGAVLSDTTFAFAVLTSSENPKQFTIPSDPDFITRLERPEASGVRYILSVPNEGRGKNDPVNRRYPSFYEDGADVATLEMEIPNTGEGQADYRLYRVSDN